MLSSRRLLSLTALAVLVSGAVVNVVPPAQQGVPNSFENTLVVAGTETDIETIVSTAEIVDQKSGPAVDEEPNHPIAETVITAVDGELTEAGISGSSSSSSSRRSLTSVHKKRGIEDYEMVFDGTGTSAEARDASIQGTAYLTFTLVNNATYNIEACLDFCSSVPQCVFANLYYEFNNYGLDFEAREQSNLKCALYGDVHTEAEKTNFGNQQSYPEPAPLIYIQQSSGWAAKTLVEPEDPEGYELVFGPTNGANNAPGYMGFAFLDKYDVGACARECNQRGADGNGGACQYFNIWRAVVNGNPTTYTCSMYYIPSDESTAVNYGQGDLQVTFSRGYRRKNFLPDGGFEGYTACSSFCYTESYANWIGTSPSGGFQDATIFHYPPYAHSGHGSALLGSATGLDNLPGELTPASPLQTVAGKKYQIAFFQNSAFSGPTLQVDAFVEVLWNGQVVRRIEPGFSQWSFYAVEVTAVGEDVLTFRGGKAPAWTFLDDIAVWQL
ncbi:hypothetical protein CC1G_05798 [Coprinopsis cinerea okayama7|uniref:Fruit-body specific protein a n=1 Tax=Coprinopsis cinerea (strain Okayama-7 / 130 / ATCC MYA-4618 / FGSC 9003) TaxID=240176 RepID=A8NLD8_COPC7|nr:hypothetical protein CC1G_05798 [Coprinopsis cinerea okayama7\|eukprot:XP_001834661.1 hypothetical protein CC1G_05798 [Coprinopsis cinerea okayama7\